MRERLLAPVAGPGDDRTDGSTCGPLPDLGLAADGHGGRAHARCRRAAVRQTCGADRRVRPQCRNGWRAGRCLLPGRISDASCPLSPSNRRRRATAIAGVTALLWDTPIERACDAQACRRAAPRFGRRAVLAVAGFPRPDQVRSDSRGRRSRHLQALPGCRPALAPSQAARQAD